MITLGHNDFIAVASAIDEDEDLLISVNVNNDWLSKEDAEKLIAHLQKVFEL